MNIFDLIIIGAGPGGYETASRAAATGLQVVLFERDYLGGTCLNRGCIPTKTFAHAADIANDVRSAAAYGIETSAPRIDLSALVERKNAVVEQLRQGIEMALSKVKIVKSEAHFIDSKTVEADGELYTAERIIIATGSAPAMLPIPGAELAVTSDALLDLTVMPQSMAIIGGGVIGLEFASIFNALGCKVTVIEYCKEILPPFDKDIAKRLRNALTAAGITFYTSSEVTAIEAPGKVKFLQKGKEAEADADIVVMAVGRRPVFPAGLEAAGVASTRRGITVDPATLLTTADGVYAIGDVNGLCMLAHAASAQGQRVLGQNINLDVIPAAVFTSPEAAMAGLTEEQCKAAGIPVKTAKSLFRANGKAVSMNSTDGMVKLIINADTRRILGCHILGPHAADIIHEVALLMANDLPVDDLTATIHAHPTLSEALLSAAHSL